ncbi:MAG: glycosyltransferase family 9 protein [bacterium]
MKISTMHFIDEIFGPPICFLFDIYNLFKRPFAELKVEQDKVKNIVLIKFFGMGSILLAGPMMSALKTRFPHTKITFLTFSSNTQLCKRIELIDKVVAIDTDTFLIFVISMLKAIRTIRSIRAEISIDLEFFSKFSTIIQYLCRTRIRVGYFLIQYGIFLKLMWRGNLLTHSVYYNPHKHTIKAFLALAESLGAHTDDLSYAQVKILDEDRKEIDRLQENNDLNVSYFLIAVNINASQICLERRWPKKNFAYLINKLRENKNIKIILLGNQGDKEYVESFLDNLDDTSNIINLVDRLGIGGLAFLLSNIDLLITNDSGPMHLAASVGTKVTALFGPETPIRYEPLGSGHFIHYPDIYCSPCLNVYNQKIAPCKGDNRCMRMIQPEDVYRSIQEKYLYVEISV